MIVDDESLNIRMVERHLKTAGYERFITISDSCQVLDALFRDEPDLVLLDVMMPAPGGLEVLRQLRKISRFEQLPVIVLTASEDVSIKVQALGLGATDFLPKPVDPTDLVPRVRNAVLLKAYHDQLKNDARRLEREVQARTIELERSRMAVIEALARAAEYRDNETGRHATRVGKYAGVIARRMGVTDPSPQLIELAAPLHDVGKIAIPDAILMKPGKLTPEEMEIVEKHCNHGKRIFESIAGPDMRLYFDHTRIGRDLIHECRTPLLDVAASIALTHHERWDGTGYPLGLAGEDIPIEGRITSVADVFDALSAKRHYKPAFPIQKCIAILDEGRGSRFDPAVLDAFHDCRSEIVSIQLAFADIN